MNDNIEEKLRKIKMKEIRNKSLGLILSLIIIEILFCIVNNFFLFFAWMILLPLLLIFQQEIFFKKAVFCYGKIIDIKKEKSLVNPGVEDEGYCITIINEIEFIDNYSNKTYKTEFNSYCIYEDYIYDKYVADKYNEEKMEKKANEFYMKDKKNIGKRIPLFYNKENPNKNLIFKDYIED